MKYPVMTIAADGAAPSKRNRHRKTHGFSCTLLRTVLWPAYKPAGNKTVMRPVFMDFCGTESEHRAFVANLRCGCAAQDGGGVGEGERGGGVAGEEEGDAWLTHHAAMVPRPRGRVNSY